MSKTRLGNNPFNEGVNALIQDTRKTVKQKKVLTGKQQASKPAKQPDTKKATYYIKPELIKELKYLAIDKDADLSTLVNEAITDLIKKHRGK